MERTRCCCGGTTGGVWDERGRQSDHWQTLWPHIRADKLRGPDSEWWELRVVESGAGRVAGSTPQPHIPAQINWEEPQGEKLTT